ncbi:WD repeat-containing protein 37-like isoform X2 [Gigantopelta aegis]|uniref:WD repeat-containing protein 37-like isoform X2 n=1 Tax=Gigantopelta aegis TaxID=1735272 RepID=UPI001B88CF44|nr:WD repeat-containing protein 37-like isoform X2 [Gigantopelta aegis]
MPTDSVAKSTKSKRVEMIRRNRSHGEGRASIPSMSRFRDDIEAEGLLPPIMRDRLYDLFGQIEKEFENLYSANLTLQERIELLAASGVDKAVIDIPDASEVGQKPKRSSQLSQRIKTTYKASTSKIVSSFRPQSTLYNLVRIYRGHRDGVWDVSASKSGHQVIGTACADHRARIFSIETGHCLVQYVGHQGSINSIRFHPSQDLVLTASGDETAHIWRPQVTLQSHSEVVKSHSSGEDDIESSEKEDADETADQIHEGAKLRTAQMELTGHVGVVMAADWMAGGSQVITASWDRQAILHDVETGEQINTLTGHIQELNEVRAHPSQRLVVTSSKDTTFRLWDFRDPFMKVNVFQGHTQPVTSAVFAGGDKIVSGSDDRTVKVWDLKNMRSPMATIRLDSSINRISVSSVNNVIAIPHDNRNIRLFDLNGVRIGRLPRTNRQGHTRMVCAVCWADDNSVSNLFSCGFDRQVLGWNINLQIKE